MSEVSKGRRALQEGAGLHLMRALDKATQADGAPRVIEYVDVAQRVVVPGFRGQQIAWLGRDGMIEKTVLRADAFEMPRCERSRLLRLRLSTTPPIDLEELARFLGTIISMEPIRVVVWGDLTGDVGILREGLGEGGRG